MKKCTLCVDRIYNDNLPEADRVPGLRRRLPDGRAAFRRSRRSGLGGLAAGRRARRRRPDARARLPAGQQIPAAARAARPPPAIRAPAARAGRRAEGGLLGWIDRMLSRLAMHPAFSVIFFTTASGAGYGLLALLGLACRPRAGADQRAGSAPSASAFRWRWSPPACCPRRCISASRSARGAPSRSGGRPGCRARA